MIYDCFQFFNELDLLKLRLNVLDPFVDRFVISESTVTFSGHKKPLFYSENKALFREFEHKIIHNVVSDTPDTTPFERDSFQKNAVARGLKGCGEDDIVLFSDLDEIPNPEKIKEILSSFDGSKIYHFAQRLFFYYLNLEETSGSFASFTGEFEGVKRKKWLGSKMFKYGFMNGRTLESMRFPEMKKNGVRVDDGGWHFSYVDGQKGVDLKDRIAYKIRSAAHQEFNNLSVISNIGKNVGAKKDIFGRRSRFRQVPIDGSFPQYLVANRKSFEGLILPHRKKLLWWCR